MNRAITLLAIFTFTLNLAAKEPTPATKEATSEIRLALNTAKSLNVFEGLPHQGFERDLLATQSKRKDTVMIGSFRFYTPSVAAKNSDKLKSILASPDTIKVFSGPKLCGGFHPD